MPKREFALKKLPGDAGDSVIVSFSARWFVPIQENGFSVVYRKHRPTKISTRWMYAYCSRPVSAIVARMPVRSVVDLPIDEALKFCDRSMHSQQQILDYAKSDFRDYTRLTVYEIGCIQCATCPIPLRFLIKEYDYWPSSTFIPLSNDGKYILDKLGRFSLKTSDRKSSVLDGASN